MNFTSTHLTARNKNNNGTGIFEREDQHNDSGKVIFSKRSSYNIALVKEDLPWVPEALSCAVSGFGQVLKSDPREKPLDQSAIPLIAPSQLQPYVHQNIQNLDVLLVGSLEISNVSNALIGLQSQ